MAHRLIADKQRGTVQAWQQEQQALIQRSRQLLERTTDLEAHKAEHAAEVLTMEAAQHERHTKLSALQVHRNHLTGLV